MAFDGEVYTTTKPENVGKLVEHLKKIRDDQYMWGSPYHCAIGYARRISGKNSYGVETDRVFNWLGISHELGDRIYLRELGSHKLGNRQDAIRFFENMIAVPKPTLLQRIKGWFS